jgi:uncharacterized protein (TIGR02246 family)
MVRLTAGVAVLVMGWCSAGVWAGQADPNEALRGEIKKTAEAFVEAFAKEDAKALSEFWAEDGDYTDLSGRRLVGRKALADDFAMLFAQNKGLTVRIEVLSMKFPTPETCIEDGVTSVLSAEGEAGGLPNRARYTNHWAKKDGKWLLQSVREFAYVPMNHYAELRPLDWTIGVWAQEVKEGHRALVRFEWSPDGNFIISHRAVEVKGEVLENGSQRIGWDPAARMIRAWSFESDGGFGHGAWMKDGDGWLVPNSAVLRSGSLMTSVAVIKRVDDNTITVQVTKQVLDGKELPDGPVMTFKRAG